MDGTSKKQEPSAPINNALKVESEHTKVIEIANAKLSDGTEHTLKSLVLEVSEESHLPWYEIAAILRSYKGPHVFELAEPRPLVSILDYARSPISILRFWVPLLTSCASVTLITISSGFGIYLRVLLGSLLVLFLPGYSLLEAIYSKRNLPEGLTTLVLSIGLSLAIDSLVTLFLNYTPFGIRLIPVSISLLGFTAACLFVSLYEKYSRYKLALNAR